LRLLRQYEQIAVEELDDQDQEARDAEPFGGFEEAGEGSRAGEP